MLRSLPRVSGIVVKAIYRTAVGNNTIKFEDYLFF